MSNAVFPTVVGISWNVARVPEFRTKIQKAVSGRELRLAFMSSPMYTFKMSYEVLRQDALHNELKKIGGFFLNRKGSFESFLYKDPSDHTATDAVFGVGVGVATEFQLARPYGDTGSLFYEEVQNIDGTPTIYVDGIEATNCSVGPTGIVTFDDPPTGVLSWTGQFFYRVRFNQDVAEFNQFMLNLFEFKKCELYGSLYNKV